MDPGELWQQNKRWALGVVVGVVVFAIGWMLIGSLYDRNAKVREMMGYRSSVSGERYGSTALQALEKEARELKDAEGRLREALEFVLPAAFSLEGKGDPGLHFDLVNRQVRQRLMQLAQSENVELMDRALDWSMPVNRDEIQSTLVALAAVDQAAQRLIQAGKRVRDRDRDALGLVAIELFKIEARRAAAARARPGRDQGPRPEDSFSEERVAFRFRSDAETARRFLQACRVEQPRLALADLKITPGPRPGEPLNVQGVLLALSFKAP
ncbi:MAG: hypothetical protein IT458_01220 [Planctomycetes bacterium]|nr:hypothetical protein [Planctomycetota bacterium]